MHREIAIAGCGVAGLACATLLTRQGARCVVYDKLDAPRPLGSGLILQPVGLNVLDRIGAGARLRALGAPIARLYGLSGRRVVLDVRYADRGRAAQMGLGVHRGALFEALFDAAREAGVAFETGREILAASGGVLTFADGRRSPRFDLVIDALGAWSPLSRRAAPLDFGALWANLDWIEGFDARALEQRYEGAHKMAGVLPIGRVRTDAPHQAAYFWSLRRDAYAAWRAAPLEAWKHQARTLWPETTLYLDHIRAHDDLVFASYAHRTLADPVGPRIAHVGDAWHCTSPQLGQGANMALLDALALAHAFESQTNLDAALGEYARLRAWHVRLYQTASFLFTPAYQSDSRAYAWVRDWLMAPLARTPPAPWLAAKLVAGELGAKSAAPSNL